MPNKNYLAGRRLEYKAKKELEEKGWKVIRASGSHGEFDLVAYRKNSGGGTTVLLLQIKRDKKTRSHEEQKICDEINRRNHTRDVVAAGVKVWAYGKGWEYP